VLAKEMSLFTHNTTNRQAYQAFNESLNRLTIDGPYAQAHFADRPWWEIASVMAASRRHLS
jgi:hypothetical protein